MAALSEKDKQAILGDNYKAILASSAADRRETEPKKWAAERIVALEGQRMSAIASVVVGVALVGSTYFTAKGDTIWIQGSVAAAFILVGIAGIAYFQSKIGQMEKML